jgi:hypothetical protein
VPVAPNIPPMKAWDNDLSQAKLFGPSTFCVGHHSHVFHRINNIKLDMDIKELAFQSKFPSTFLGFLQFLKQY